MFFYISGVTEGREELLVGLLVEALLYLSLLVQPSKLTIFIDILHEEE